MRNPRASHRPPLSQGLCAEPKGVRHGQTIVSIDVDKAAQLALDFASQQYREALEVRPVKQLPAGHYWVGHSAPEDWLFFVVIDKPRLRVGGNLYIGVNKRSLEARSFGELGE